MKYSFLFLLVISFLSFNAQVTEVKHHAHQHTTPEKIHFSAISFMLANDVNIRSSSSKESEIVDNLSVGSAFFVISDSGITDTINGIASNWYEIYYNKKKGFVWGGFIAEKAIGSSQNGAVKFVIGLESYGLKTKTIHGEEHESLYYTYQIRAFKNGEQLDKFSFDHWYRFGYDYYGQDTRLNLGKMGVSGLDDILEFHTPCEGGCGCTTGSEYIAWNGTQFHHMIEAYGMADGEYSGGSGIIFPSDLTGIPGIVIKDYSIISYLGELDDNGENYDSNLERREAYQEHYIWDGTKLVLQKRTPSIFTEIDDY